MPRMKIGEIKFSKVYPMYVQKAGRTKAEVDEVANGKAMGKIKRG